MENQGKHCGNCMIECVCQKAGENVTECPYWSERPTCDNCRLNKLCGTAPDKGWCPNHDR